MTSETFLFAPVGAIKEIIEDHLRAASPPLLIGSEIEEPRQYLQISKSVLSNADKSIGMELR